MTKAVRPRRMSHMNLVMDNFDSSVAHFGRLFGAVFLKDLPGPNWHAYLVDIGGVILEIFVPPAFMLSSRHGAHYLGVEYEADMADAHAAVATNGIRIMRDIKLAFHTDPADGFGVDYEFYGGSFYTNEPPHLDRLCAPAEYWRDEHPLGLTGLVGYSHAVGDLDKATRFLQDFLGGEVLYEEARPALAALARGVRIADDIAELIMPLGEGALRTEMYRQGEGIRSTTFRVRDLEQARDYFHLRGITPVAGTAPASIAIKPADNMGVRFEFCE